MVRDSMPTPESVPHLGKKKPKHKPSNLSEFLDIKDKYYWAENKGGFHFSVA